MDDCLHSFPGLKPTSTMPLSHCPHWPIPPSPVILGAWCGGRVGSRNAAPEAEWGAWREVICHGLVHVGTCITISTTSTDRARVRNPNWQSKWRCGSAGRWARGAIQGQQESRMRMRMRMRMTSNWWCSFWVDGQLVNFQMKVSLYRSIGLVIACPTWVWLKLSTSKMGWLPGSMANVVSLYQSCTLGAGTEGKVGDWPGGLRGFNFFLETPPPNRLGLLELSKPANGTIINQWPVGFLESWASCSRGVPTWTRKVTFHLLKTERSTFPFG